MNNFTWSIEEITAENEIITSAKYRVLAKTQDESQSVETEGNWFFNGKINKSYADITEQDVIELIKKESVVDGINIIESRLDEQLDYLAKVSVKTPAPWQPQVFTPNV